MGQGGLMSAINSNSGERDFDAIHSAQRAHEPSMEEILASIRNMIVDDSKGPSPRPPAPTPTPQIIPSKEAAPAPHGAAQPSQRSDMPGPAVVWRRTQAAEAAPAPGDLKPSEEPLLSAAASEAAALSFGALSANLEVRSGELADSMVREMLRPMLKQWLDENLPPIVERLVRAEIERVARGGK